jgi:small-conductance mechanosensitive channel
MISRMFWVDIWKLTATKTTSVRVVTNRLIERCVIYRDIFQNIVKYFELVISIYMISRMFWTDIWKLTVTKTTSVRVAIKRLIERSVIYRDIFQNIVKYFKLILYFMFFKGWFEPPHENARETWCRKGIYM